MPVTFGFQAGKHHLEVHVSKRFESMLEDAKKTHQVPGKAEDESLHSEPDRKATGSKKAALKADAGNAENEPSKKEKKKKKKEKNDGLGSSRGIETMFRTSYRTNMDLSSLADSKANIMISINGLIISIILASISPKIDANPWLLVPTAVLLIGCLISIVLAVFAARPRVSSKVIELEDVRSGQANPLFFGNFVSMPEKDFIVAMKELLQNTDRLYISMIRDIYGLGTVLEKKFRLLRGSYSAFMVGLMAGVILFIAVYAWIVFYPGSARGMMP